MRWLRMLNPVAQRDAERAYWRLMFIPVFTHMMRNRMGGRTITKPDVIDISQQAAKIVAEENFEAGSTFIDAVDLKNASNNLDFSSREICEIICSALDKKEIENIIVNALEDSKFLSLMKVLFQISAERAMKGAEDGHLKFSPAGIRNKVMEQFYRMPL